MTEVLSSSEEISIDDEAVWDIIRPGTGYKKCYESIDEEPSHCDALSDREDCPSRSSSPEVEILEVFKNKSHITVDLTLDDDDAKCEADSTSDNSSVNDQSCDKNAPSFSAHTSESAPVLDISDDETDSNQEGTHAEVASVQQSNPGDNSSPAVSSSFPCSTLRHDNGESYFKKPKLAWSSKFNEEDALSLLEKLESYVNLPKISVKQEGLDFSGSSSTAPVSHEHSSPGSSYASSVASSSQRVSSQPQCINPSNSQYFNSSDNHIPVITSGSTASAVSQDVNSPQVVSSHSNPTNSLLVTSLPGHEGRGQSGNLQNSFPTTCVPNRNPDTSDLLALSLLEAELTSEINIPNSNSAFQTVSPSTYRPVSSASTDIASNSLHLVTPGTSDVLWNGVQPSSSTCSNGVYVQSSANPWKPVLVSNADVSGLGEFAECLQSGFKCPATQSVSNVTYNGGADGISQQGLSLPINSSSTSNAFNTSQYMIGSTNGDYRQWSPSDFIATVQQSSVAPVQENSGFASTSQSSVIHASTSQSSVIHVPAPVDLSSSSNTEQSSNLLQSTEVHLSVLPVLSPTYIIEQTSYPDDSNLHGSPAAGTQNQHNDISVTKDCDNVLESKSAYNSKPDPYADPPSPDGPTISCHICLDSVKTIQSSSRHLCSTVCGHIFCSDCLKASLKQKKECPMCRKRLSKKQYHPLFL